MVAYGLHDSLYHQSDEITYLTILILLLLIVVLFSLLYTRKKFYKLHQSLFLREELFNSLCSTIDDVFLIYHFGNKVIEYVSPNFDRAYGINGKHFKKNPFLILNLLDYDLKEKIKSFFTTNILMTNQELEFQLLDPKTKKITFHIVRIYPIIKRNIVIRYIISISDLTRIKLAQQTIKDALLNAQLANEAKKDFLSHMSHEIKTPINAIIGMSQLAIRDIGYIGDQDKVVDRLNKISDASKKLIVLVNNILDMSRMDSNRLKIAHEPFHIISFLKDFTSIVKSQAELSRLKYILDYTGLITENILGDSLRLQQILLNCTSNAIKFTPPGGFVKIKVREMAVSSNKVILHFKIIDNGKGMSEEYIDRIFIPFDQEDPQIYSNFGGSGLGMSITKNLVTLMSGDIQVKSQIGVGTTISIILPFDVHKPKELPEYHDQIDKETCISDIDLTGHRILIVEDNTINLEIICEYLKLSHATLDAASNGREAIKYFELSPPSYYDIILMDIHLPELNGYEVTRLIRQSTHPDAKNIKIIAMSADSYPEDIAIALDSGMNYHVAKPIDFKKLLQFLKDVLQKR